MAVKKVEKSDKAVKSNEVETTVKEEEVVVDTELKDEDVQDDVQQDEEKNEENVDIETTVETPVVEVEDVKVSEPKSDIVVDTESTEVKPSKKPSGNVRIKMRVDHKCTIAMERYDLKEGKTYTVPANVKRILNNAGLLAPL